MENLLLRTLLLVIFLSHAVGTASAATGEVHAHLPHWQFENESLEANSTYIVLPDPTSRWTLDKNVDRPLRNSFHGSSRVESSKTLLATPGGQNKIIQLGGLLCLVWHFQNEARTEMVPEIISFPADMNQALIRTGPHGASIHFMIVDLIGTTDRRKLYTDNEGCCRVTLARDDGTNVRSRLPITASKASARWTIDQMGAVKGAWDWTRDAEDGRKTDTTAIVVEYFDGGHYFHEGTKTIEADVLRGKSGTHAFDGPSIPLEKAGQIRRVYVFHDPDRNLSAEEWRKDVVKGLKSPNNDYEQLKKLGLVQDAVKLLVRE